MFVFRNCIAMKLLTHEIFVFNIYIYIVLQKLVKLSLCHDSDLEDYLSNGHYTNDWVIQVLGGPMAAQKIADQFRYKNMGPLNGFNNTFLLRKDTHPRRTKRHAFHYTKELTDDDRVVWAEQQIARPRVKRDFIGSFWTIDPLERGKKPPFPFVDTLFNDELWRYQWYLHDSGNIANLPKLDLNVRKVWSMGFTGKGVVVTVLDDGLEWNHTDIIKNYDENASCDTNDNDKNPFPRYDRYDSNSHGTRCAGEISMISQNGKCGVGIAYEAKIGGIRCLDGEVSDAVEALSIGFNTGYIDIYSSSWGPNDDGMTVDGPKRLASESLIKGITDGRNGKGCIYIWASGNGGIKGDNCNCDGYASSIYTLSIGSATQRGSFPWYGERCSSTIAVTYSSGTYTDQKIATIDLHNKCTIDHSGTSAAAPLAAGIIALVLQANPNLTWRDVQHLVVCTSEFTPLMENRGWKRNNAGFLYNSRFGFGVMNAEELVIAALHWVNVPPKVILHIYSSLNEPMDLESGKEILINFFNDESEIMSLEHVQVNVSLEYTRRGNIDMFLVSPKGSMTMLLSQRPKDASVLGFRNWCFTSVHLWGENPMGKWTLIIRDKNGHGHRGKLKHASLILHGTKEIFGYLKHGPKIYKEADLVNRTIDDVPETLESLSYNQNMMENNLNRIHNPLRFELISDYVGSLWQRISKRFNRANIIN